MLKLFLSLLVVFQLIANSTFAQKFHDQYIDWASFSNEQGTKSLCYVVAIPMSRSGSSQNRGESYFLVTKTKDKLPEISISSGYYYQKDSEVELSFGLRKFNMLTYKSQAWTYEIDDDIEVIKAMRTSDDVVVKSISDQNKVSFDTYSLVGFSKAYEDLQNNCK
jgi:hypothetical protein